MNNFIVSVSQALKQLHAEKDQPFTLMMRNGRMSVEYFAPDKIDLQKPHLQDELYVIVSGQSQFYRNGEIVNCKQGDIIFVPAGMEHRFLNFSENFSTWVIFYGEEKALQATAGD